MRIRLAYGDTGLDVDLDPAVTTVVEPLHHPGAAEQSAVLRAALRHPVAGPPLRDRVRPGRTVAISACDGTRPQPRHLMIPAVLAELDGIVRDEDVVILVATGTQADGVVGVGPGGDPFRAGIRARRERGIRQKPAGAGRPSAAVRTP
ncbi:lactate racemase domain-containing protein [Kitasatospora sp. NPDC058965]|uniref:lactate racemase domain-containing protein n=1 Tax=Kitasatospora sp. NPDC058965 TaxID=3346682 RepID=UPI0036798423